MAYPHTDDCTCYRCEKLSVSFSSSAMPTRKGSAETIATNQREARWHKDIPAYQSLVKNGVQPRTIDGCHDVAQSTAEKFEIATGVAVPGKAAKQRTRDTLIELGHKEYV